MECYTAPNVHVSQPRTSGHLPAYQPEKAGKKCLSVVAHVHRPSALPSRQSQLPRHLASSMGNLLGRSLNILCVLMCTYSCLLTDTIMCAVYTPECCMAAGTVVTGFKYQLKAVALMIGADCSLHPTSQEGRPSRQLHSSCFSYFCYVLEHSQKGQTRSRHNSSSNPSR